MKTNYSIIASVLESDDKGNLKVKKRTYIISINSDSCSAAEEFIKNEIGSQIQEIFSIKKIKVDMYLNLDSVGDNYYTAKVTYLIEDDDTGKIKKQTTVSYILASDIIEVKELVQNELKNQIHEAFIISVTKTNIKEILTEN